MKSETSKRILRAAIFWGVVLVIVAFIAYLVWSVLAPTKSRATPEETTTTIVTPPGPQYHPIPPAGPLWTPHPKPLSGKRPLYAHRQPNGDLVVGIKDTSPYEIAGDRFHPRRYSSAYGKNIYVGRFWTRIKRTSYVIHVRRIKYGAWRTGYASTFFEPQVTASGVSWSGAKGIMFAHRTLPLFTHAQFIYRGRKTIGRCLDRGPAAWTGRDLDFAPGIANRLRFDGVGHVRWRPFWKVWRHVRVWCHTLLWRRKPVTKR